MKDPKEVASLVQTFPHLKTLKRRGFFIECGANDGVYFSICNWFERELGWHGMNVECNPYAFEELKRNRPNCINVNYALGNRDGETVKFMIPRKDCSKRDRLTGNASLMYLANWGGLSVENVGVEMITYPTLLQKHEIEYVDLFVLDIEGAEVPVLETIPTWKVRPAILSVEFILYPGLYKALARDMVQFNYKFVHRCGHNAFFKDVS
jgi:FkbM family methyltransferase